MTIWFCVKTIQTPDTVAEVVCSFNTFEEEISNDKCIWFIEKAKAKKNTGESYRKMNIRKVFPVWRWYIRKATLWFWVRWRMRFYQIF